MNQTEKKIVFVTLKEGVLDPEGVTIEKALSQMGYSDIKSVRTGKFFEIEIDASASDIDKTINEVSSKLLSNPVIENFEVEGK